MDVRGKYQVSRLEATPANIYSADIGPDVGEDSGAPVSPNYASVENEASVENVINGVIKGVQLSIAGDAETGRLIDPADAVRAMMGRQ